MLEANSRPDDQERPRRCKHCGTHVTGGHAERLQHRNECTARPPSGAPGGATTAPTAESDARRHCGRAAPPAVPQLLFIGCQYCGKLFPAPPETPTPHGSPAGAAASRGGARRTPLLAAHEAECVRRLPAAHRRRLKHAKKLRSQEEGVGVGGVGVDGTHSSADESPAPSHRSVAASTATISGLKSAVPARQLCVTQNLDGYDRTMAALVQRVLPPLSKLARAADGGHRTDWAECRYCRKRVVAFLRRQHEASSCIVASVMGKVDRIGEILAASQRLDNGHEEENGRSPRQPRPSAAAAASAERARRRGGLKRLASVKELKEHRSQALERTNSTLVRKEKQPSPPPPGAAAAASVPVQGSVRMRSGLFSPRHLSMLPERDALLEEARHCIAVIDAVVPLRDFFLSQPRGHNERVLDPSGIAVDLAAIEAVFGKIMRRVTIWMDSFSRLPQKAKQNHKRKPGAAAAPDDSSEAAVEEYPDDFDDSDESETDRGRRREQQHVAKEVATGPSSGRVSAPPRSQRRSGRAVLSSQSVAANPFGVPSTIEVLHKPLLHLSAHEQPRSRSALDHAAFLAKTKTSDYMGWEHEAEWERRYGDALQSVRRSARRHTLDTRRATSGRSAGGSAAATAAASKEKEEVEQGQEAEEGLSAGGVRGLTSGKRCRFDAETLRLAKAVCDGTVTLSEAVDEATAAAQQSKGRRGSPQRVGFRTATGAANI